MATVLESLKSISDYPIQGNALSDIALRRGLNLADTVTESVLTSAAYRLATADILRWVSFTPNVQQADVSYSLLYSDRVQMRALANDIYGELGDGEYIPEYKAKFGYKGSRM